MTVTPYILGARYKLGAHCIYLQTKPMLYSVHTVHTAAILKKPYCPHYSTLPIQN